MTTTDQPSEDARWMQRCLELAAEASAHDEVPVGAVVVLDGRLLGEGRNRVEERRSPLAHAEMDALQQALVAVGEKRIPDATLYWSLEPCFLCAGALLHARAARVVWGVRDDKFGGCVSLGSLLSDPRLNHRAEITEGVGAGEARDLLQQFFRKKRASTDQA